jgi:WD40 repeat protein
LNTAGDVICIDASGTHLALGLSTGVVVLWKLSGEGKEKSIPLPVEFRLPTSLSFAFDGTLLAVGSFKGDIAFIEVDNGTLLHTFQDIHQARIIAIKLIYCTFDHSVLAVASSCAHAIQHLTHFQKGIFKHDIDK